MTSVADTTYSAMRSTAPGHDLEGGCTVCPGQIRPLLAATRFLSGGTDRDWLHEPLHRLADHIVTAYHDPLRAELPNLVAAIAKLAAAHAADAPHLTRLARIVSGLAVDLIVHMRDEERLLFPAIRALERGMPVASLAGPLAAREREHLRVSEVLDEMRLITRGYEVPEWRCDGLRSLYRDLADLDSALWVHGHLESDVLFARALAMEAGL